MLGFWIEMSHLVLQDNKNGLEVDQTYHRLSVCVRVLWVIAASKNYIVNS